ncbi:MAG: type IV pilin protein [Steroidobacteraceae bacterium]
MQAQEHAALNRNISQLGSRAGSRGVTLLELMAVVLILGILTTISVSSYRGYLLRTNRTDARMQLLRVQAAQEKYFLQNNRYADTGELSTAPAAGGLGIPAATPGGHYAITLARPTTTTYTATATAVGGQTSDKAACQVLTINETGDRTPTASDCWR